jgi:hypothetical protein
MDVAPSHAVLRPGVVVSIGLDKNTKLSSVFSRFVEFCNESTSVSGTAVDRIDVADLEFIHCQLLNPNDTAEASALMKNDKIHVRSIRTGQREAESERKRIQRDADRDYFRQLRHLMPDLGGSRSSDIILDCRGKLLDENGRNQQVLCTTVRAHSSLLSRRCKWLHEIIIRARLEAARKRYGELTPDDGIIDNDGADVLDGSNPRKVSRVESEGKNDEDKEDDGIGILPFPPVARKRQASGGATEIENDDDEELVDLDALARCRPDSPDISGHLQSSYGGDLLWITLADHSPEAVKLLLEFCYTNRVLPLGQEAFIQACKSKPQKYQGPVPPYQSNSTGSRRWPNNGQPLVSFSVALAGIALAEDASMHRLSLMCEVAASQLLTASNVVEALSVCTTQKMLTGNSLSRLRKATMNIVLRNGSRGVIELGRNPSFKRALQERASLLVPTLLEGTMEAVTAAEKARKEQTPVAIRDRNAATESCYDELDRADSYERERERRKRRQERHKDDPLFRQGEPDVLEPDTDEVFDPIRWDGASAATKRSLKRMSHHLAGSFAAVAAAGRERNRRGDSAAFGAGRAFNFGGRRTNGRRRGPERG